MRGPVKGGVWTNVEDEILKVAVMKYGLNQWARISSLLVRKTPKMCKARWNEWLDPRIRKTEWSQEEDEKLLHLARVFPSQWGTISDLVGRTSQMCIERYEKLLDNASLSGGVGASEARKLKPGEVDPSPETKPARPDPVDMDEDEKEMLAEARARLANTQGKKAKRKAREKLLEEARRAAAFQKRKELVAAGLPGLRLKHHQKSRGMDYNVEIPFERKPAPGFHDPTEELAEEEAEHDDLIRQRPRREVTKYEVELAARKNDLQKDKERLAEGMLPISLERKLKEQQTVKRAPLHLPAPQLSDSDLEQIVKSGLINTYQQQNLLIDSSMNAATPLSVLRKPSTPMSVHSARTSSTSTSLYGKTPIRDPYGINESVRRGYDEFESARLAHAYAQNRLADAFRSLPPPKNDFDILLPE